MAAAHRFNPGSVIRLARTSNGVEPLLADHPESGDVGVRDGEVVLHVAPGIEGLVDVEEPHDRIVLRPRGSTPNPRPE